MRNKTINDIIERTNTIPLEDLTKELKTIGIPFIDIHKIAELTAQMETLDNYDTETAHMIADEILIKALKEVGGMDKLIEAYEKLHKWYA